MSVAPAPSNKELCACFFHPSESGNKSKVDCNACESKDITISKSGYTNQVKHLESKGCLGSLGEAYALFHERQVEKQNGKKSSVQSAFAPRESDATKKIFGWISLIVFCNMTLNACRFVSGLRAFFVLNGITDVICVIVTSF